jgi:hypothetical protein
MLKHIDASDYGSPSLRSVPEGQWEALLEGGRRTKLGQEWLERNSSLPARLKADAEEKEREKAELAADGAVR